MKVIQKALVVIATVFLGTLIIILQQPDNLPLKGRGIPCENIEGTKIHFHFNLQIFKDGANIALPHNIGIVGDCFYWVHTHDEDGIVHIESPVEREFTLDEFFDIWGTDLFAQTKPTILIREDTQTEFRTFKGPTSELVLKPHQIIAIGTGTFTPEYFSFPAGL